MYSVSVDHLPTHFRLCGRTRSALVTERRNDLSRLRDDDDGRSDAVETRRGMGEMMPIGAVSGRKYECKIGLSSQIE